MPKPQTTKDIAAERDLYWWRMATLRARLREAVELMPLNSKKREAWFAKATESLSQMKDMGCLYFGCSKAKTFSTENKERECVRCKGKLEQEIYRAPRHDTTDGNGNLCSWLEPLCLKCYTEMAAAALAAAQIKQAQEIIRQNTHK